MAIAAPKDTNTILRIIVGVLMTGSPNAKAAPNDNNTLLRQIAGLIAAASSGGAPLPNTTAPTSETDFSMFTGGVAPASGQYQALDADFIWTYLGGESTWKNTPRSTP